MSATSKTIVITGANSGIGFEAAAHFASRGARVVLGCRDLDKGAAAEREIRARAPAAELVLLAIDLADLDSVRSFARAFAERVGELDLLINNAGVVGVPLERNAAGHELHLATNHLGPFALTGLLLPQFCPQRRARVVNVGSLAHRFAKLELQNLNWEARRYDHWKAYANSKLALLNFTVELDRRLRVRGANIVALAAHPGFANTKVGENSPAMRDVGPLRKWCQTKITPLIPSAAEATRPILLAAESDLVSGGEYYGPRGPLEVFGEPGRARLDAAAQDPELGRRLWALSESLTQVSYLSDPS